MVSRRPLFRSWKRVALCTGPSALPRTPPGSPARPCGGSPASCPERIPRSGGPWWVWDPSLAPGSGGRNRRRGPDERRRGRRPAFGAVVEHARGPRRMRWWQAVSRRARFDCAHLSAHCSCGGAWSLLRPSPPGRSSRGGRRTWLQPGHFAYRSAQSPPWRYDDPAAREAQHRLGR